MKGLILKDVYMVWKYCKSLLLMALVFLVVSAFGQDSMFFAFYPCIFAGMLSMTILSYDERQKWTEYSGTLPYSRRQLVSVKYLLGFGGSVVTVILTAIAQGIRMIYFSELIWGNYFGLLVWFFAMSLLVPAVMLPFIFKLGVEKGRIAYFISIGLVCGVCVFFTTDQTLSSLPTGNALVLLVLLLAMTLYALSWYLSVRFYEKREI